jgi:hypothetical protein
MGLFGRRDRQQRDTTVPPMGSGRALQSGQSPTDGLATLDRVIRAYRPPNYHHSPSYVPAGWEWLSADDRPEIVVAFNDQGGDFMLLAIWPAPPTRLGLFPLGSGDERLRTVPVIGLWKQADPSLMSTGVVAAESIRLMTPVVPSDYVHEMLVTADCEPTAENVASTGTKVGEMFLIKALQCISSRSESEAQRFGAAHRYTGEPFAEFYQSILDDLVRWDPGITPYIQELPARIRAIMLEENTIGPLTAR